MNKLGDSAAFLKNILTTTISDNIKDLICFKHSFSPIFLEKQNLLIFWWVNDFVAICPQDEYLTIDAWISYLNVLEWFHCEWEWALMYVLSNWTEYQFSQE